MSIITTNKEFPTLVSDIVLYTLSGTKIVSESIHEIKIALKCNPWGVSRLLKLDHSPDLLWVAPSARTSQTSHIGVNPLWSYTGAQYKDDGEFETIAPYYNSNTMRWEWNGVQYTNMLQNTGFEGAVSGTPGTAPTGWGWYGSGSRTVNGQSITYSTTNSRIFEYVSVSLSTNTTYYFCADIELIGSGQSIQEIISTSIPTGATRTFIVDGVTLASGVTNVTTGRHKVCVVLAVAGTGGPTQFSIGAGVGSEKSMTVTISNPILTTIRNAPYVASPAGGTTTVYSVPVPAVHGDKGVWCGPSYSNLIGSMSPLYPGFNYVNNASRASGIYPDKDGGQNGVKLLFPSGDSYAYLSGTMAAITTTFTISAWVKGTAGQITSLRANANASVNPSVVLSSTDSNVSLSDLNRVISRTFELTGDWQYISLSVTSSVALTGNWYPFYINDRRVPGVTATELLICSPQVTATNVPMPYIPPGTTVASAAGTSGNNGIWWDMAKEPDGVELIYNGGFDTNVDGWVAGNNGVITCVSGRLVAANTNARFAYACQCVSTIVGAKYKLTGVFTHSGYSGRVDIGTGFGYSNLSTVAYANSTSIDIEFVATSTITYISLMTNDATVNANSITTWDNISVQRLTSPLMKCFERPETDGVELVTNGKFDNGITGWSSTQSGALSIESGRLKMTGVSHLVQNRFGTPITCQIGSVYEVTATCYRGTTGGDLYIIAGQYVGWAAFTSQPIQSTTPVTVKFRFVATHATMYIGGNDAHSTAGSTSYWDNFSVQKLKPATCTVAALVTMGAGSASLPNSTVVNCLSPDIYSNSGIYASKSGSGVVYKVYSFDRTTPAYGAYGDWSGNEQHLKVVHVNAAGTQFRVGNQCIGIDASIQWGSWFAYDGSFNPLTHLRAAYGNTVPLWLSGLQVWTEPEVSESDIEEYFKSVGVL